VLCAVLRRFIAVDSLLHKFFAPYLLMPIVLFVLAVVIHDDTTQNVIRNRSFSSSDRDIVLPILSVCPMQLLCMS